MLRRKLRKKLAHNSDYILTLQILKLIRKQYLPLKIFLFDSSGTQSCKNCDNAEVSVSDIDGNLTLPRVDVQIPFTL